jgi:hypothetical protein
VTIKSSNCDRCGKSLPKTWDSIICCACSGASHTRTRGSKAVYPKKYCIDCSGLLNYRVRGERCRECRKRHNQNKSSVVNPVLTDPVEIDLCNEPGCDNLRMKSGKYCKICARLYYETDNWRDLHPCHQRTVITGYDENCILYSGRSYQPIKD